MYFDYLLHDPTGRKNNETGTPCNQPITPLRHDAASAHTSGKNNETP